MITLSKAEIKHPIIATPNKEKTLKRISLIIFLFAIVFLTGQETRLVFATPSTTYWTPATTAIQPFKVWHLGIDNYFTLRDPNKADVTGPADFPTDVGLTVGVFPWNALQAEVGVDYLSPFSDPWSFNAKIGTPEGEILPVSLNVGVFNVGTQKDVTDFNIVHVMAGKSLGSPANIYVGAYSGNKKLLINDQGDKENTGFMVGFDYWLVKDKFQFAADYASGENALGGGGFGLYWYFASNASVLTGPVWFNQDSVNGDWKWTTQLDVNF